MRFTSNSIIFEMQQTGHIELIYGPMFSGKSSELLRKIRRYEHAKKKCLVVNYVHDNRYTDTEEMATHDQYFLSHVESLVKLLSYQAWPQSFRRLKATMSSLLMKGNSSLMLLTFVRN